MNPFQRLSAWLGGGADPVTPVYEASGDAGRVLERLSGILDPELGVDIVSLGLVRAVEVSDGRLALTVTLTTEGCPVGPAIADQIVAACQEIGFDPEVTWTFSPPWTPEHIRPGAEPASYEV